MGVVAINPRGSFGYGQKFVDQISRDWGGKAYTDLMNGLDAALARTMHDLATDPELAKALASVRTAATL